jgi:hypothetical protein
LDSGIVIALIAAGGGLLGSGIGVIASSRLTTYRLEQLEKKVDKHNQLVDRMYKCEARLGIVEAIEHEK